MLRARVQDRRAFTAIEALIASAILALLTAAVSSALMAGRAQSQYARDSLTASFLGQSLMDEIMRLPFDDPSGYVTMGPDLGETSRSLYNNIDDYAGYTDGPNTLSDLAGNLYPTEYQNFVRTVSMTATTATPTGWNRTISGLLITVTVSRDGRELMIMRRIAWD